MGEREALLTERAGHRMAVARPSCVCVTGLWTRTSGSPASDNKDGNKKAGRLPDLLARSGGELGIRKALPTVALWRLGLRLRHVTARRAVTPSRVRLPSRQNSETKKQAGFPTCLRVLAESWGFEPQIPLGGILA